MDRDLTFRRATLADSERVCIFDGVYGGLDPLDSERSELFLQAPFRYTFVAELPDGTPVSSLGLLMTDGGRTAFYYGARTHPAHRERGIQTRLRQYGLQYVRGLGLPVERFWLTSWEPYYTDEYLHTRHDKKLILRKRVLNLRMTPNPNVHEILNRLKREVNTSHLSSLPPKNLVDLIESDEPQLRKLFKKNLFFIGFHCCEASAENRDVINEFIDHILVGRNAQGRIESLSTSDGFRKKFGQRRDITIYTDDLETALGHTLMQLEHLANEFPDDVIEFMFHFEVSVDGTAFETFLMREETRGLMDTGLAPRENRFLHLIQQNIE